MSFERRLTNVERVWRDRDQPVRLDIPDELNIIEFCVEVLGFTPYPVQALLLKLIVGARDLLTAEDYQILDHWATGYNEINRDHFTGPSGTTPDIRDRLEHIGELNRWSFREVILVLGRRAGKSQITAAIILWTMWRLICLGNPQAEFGMPDRKTISAVTFSTDRDAVTRTLFGDIKRLVDGSAVFADFVAGIDKHRVTLYTPYQLAAGDRLDGRPGSLVIEALPATAVATRGLSIIAVGGDEAAFVDGFGSTDDCAEIMRAAAPAMAQFGNEAITILASSPATRTGQFYESHQRSCAVDTAGAAVNPDTLMVHAASWDLYDRWDTAHHYEMYSGGQHYPRFRRPIVTRDSPEVLTQLRNDDRVYRFEFCAVWNDVLNAFFSEHERDAMFADHLGAPLTPRYFGDMRHQYWIHIDPSVSIANTALVVAHVETIDNFQHLVVDLIKVWKPREFADGVIDYKVVVPAVAKLWEAFNPTQITIDTYGGHVLQGWLTEKLTASSQFAPIEVVSANVREKLARYDRLRTLAASGLVHLPDHELARLELAFVRQDGSRVGAPSSGPCRTDDIVDCLTWLAQIALDPSSHTIARFGQIQARGGVTQWGPHPLAEQFRRAYPNDSRQMPRNPARGIRRNR